MSKIKKIIAILLVVLFLVTVTAGAASASVSPLSGKAPLTVKLTDKSTGSPTGSLGDTTYGIVMNTRIKRE
jgi:PKD repeat protein